MAFLARIVLNAALAAALLLSAPSTATGCEPPTAAIVGRAPCSWGLDLVCFSVQIQNRLDRPISFVQGSEPRLVGEWSTRYETRRAAGGVWENQVVSLTDYSAKLADFPKLTIEKGGTGTFVVYFPKGMVSLTRSTAARVVLVDTEGHRYETDSLTDTGESID